MSYIKHTYRLGNFVCTVEMPAEMPVPAVFELFETTGAAQDIPYEYTIRIAESLPLVEGKRLALRDNMEVLALRDIPAGPTLCDNPAGSMLRDAMDLSDVRDQSKRAFECRYLGLRETFSGSPERLDEERARCYAFTQETSENSSLITVAKAYADKMDIDTLFTSLFSFEKRMLAKNSLILHTSYVEVRGKAVLFSGPSGIGKSTQGGLWKKYRGCETINGDRALLAVGDRMACGWPVSGSSGICRNEAREIGAIVFLDQAKENAVRTMRPAEAFSGLFSQITVNRWDQNAVGKSCDLIENLIANIPVLHLDCDISEAAVDVLDAALPM